MISFITLNVYAGDCKVVERRFRVNAGLCLWCFEISPAQMSNSYARTSEVIMLLLLLLSLLSLLLFILTAVVLSDAQSCTKLWLTDTLLLLVLSLPLLLLWLWLLLLRCVSELSVCPGAKLTTLCVVDMKHRSRGLKPLIHSLNTRNKSA